MILFIKNESKNRITDLFIKDSASMRKRLMGYIDHLRTSSNKLTHLCNALILPSCWLRKKNPSFWKLNYLSHRQCQLMWNWSSSSGEEISTILLSFIVITFSYYLLLEEIYRLKQMHSPPQTKRYYPSFE